MKYIVVTFAFCLLVTSAQAGTYINNFDDGNLDSWIIFDFRGGVSEWKIEDGVLVCRRQKDATSSLLYGEESWGAYSIECDAKMVEILANAEAFHSIALDLRVSDIDNAASISDIWCAVLKYEGAFIWAWLNGNSGAKSVVKAFDLQLDRWYHLKATTNGNNFEFYIDGEFVASLSESQHPTGRVGLAVTGSVAHFDNLVITGDDVPDNSNLSAISASGKLATIWGQLRSQ